MKPSSLQEHLKIHADKKDKDLSFFRRTGKEIFKTVNCIKTLKKKKSDGL